MKSIFVLSIILLSIQLSKCADKKEKKECKITEQEAEACGARMMMFNDNFTMPKDQSDIEEKCKFINEGITCFKEYAKNCLESFQSRIMGMVARNGKKLADKICETPESRTELLNHLQCWKTAENMAPINLCLDKYMVQMESVGDVDSDNRIPATCCSFYMVKDCMKTAGNEKCDKPESVEYLEKLATGITGDMIKFVCGNFKSLEECDKKLDKDIWSNLKKMVESNDPQEIKKLKKYDSPLGALKNIIKKMKN